MADYISPELLSLAATTMVSRGTRTGTAMSDQGPDGDLESALWEIAHYVYDLHWPSPSPAQLAAKRLALLHLDRLAVGEGLKKSIARRLRAQERAQGRAQ